MTSLINKIADNLTTDQLQGTHNCTQSEWFAYSLAHNICSLVRNYCEVTKYW